MGYFRRNRWWHGVMLFLASIICCSLFVVHYLQVSATFDLHDSGLMRVTEKSRSSVMKTSWACMSDLILFSKE